MPLYCMGHCENIITVIRKFTERKVIFYLFIFTPLNDSSFLIEACIQSVSIHQFDAHGFGLNFLKFVCDFPNLNLRKYYIRKKEIS